MIWIKIPLKEDKCFNSVYEAKIYIENEIGAINGKFEISEQGIIVSGIDIVFYIGDKQGNRVRNIETKEIKILEKEIKTTKKIGKTNITYGEFYGILRKMSREWKNAMRDDTIEKFNIEIYIKLFISTYLAMNKIDYVKQNKINKILKKLFTVLW